MTDTGYEARVITLPVERTLTAARRTRRVGRAPASWPRSARGTSTTGAATPRSSASPAGSRRLRWDTVVGGDERLPGARRRRWSSSTPAASRWRRSTPRSRSPGATGRPVRFVGRPDVAPVGALARRLGGLLARPDEVAGALRAGELLVMPATRRRSTHAASAASTTASSAPRSRRRRRSSRPATASSPWSRSRAHRDRPAVRPSKRRRGPLIELELADLVEQRIQRILDEFGGTRTGTPLDWLPLSGMGGS